MNNATINSNNSNALIAGVGLTFVPNKYMSPPKSTGSNNTNNLPPNFSTPHSQDNYHLNSTPGYISESPDEK